MKLTLLSLILPFSVCLSQQGGLADVFPLSVGNEWTYHSLAWSDGDPYNAVGDSGMVYFTVVDSITTSDSTRWIFREVHDGWHFIDVWYWSDPDKLWQVKDTLFFEIVESNTGRHRLLRNEVEWVVWGSVFPWFPNLTDTTAIYRYAEVDARGLVRLITRDPRYYSNEYDMTFKSGIGPVEVISTPVNPTAGTHYWANHYLLGAIVSSVLDDKHLGIPKGFLLHQNYPNPFNPSTTIEYQLPRRGYVSLRVFNLLGQVVAVLVDDVQEAGHKSVAFNASHLPSGVYLYRLAAGELTETKKLVVLK